MTGRVIVKLAIPATLADGANGPFDIGGGAAGAPRFRLSLDVALRHSRRASTL